MKNSIILKAILLVSGVIATGIGATILFVPVTFYASYGIDLGGNVSLLNELKAPALAMLAGGILIMSGAFLARLTHISIVVAAFLYLSFGLSRLLSMAMDGMPAEGLVQAAALEIVVGLACVFALVKYREIGRTKLRRPDRNP
ncbi:MAG: DUF4345 domain-containing protein [Hyphomicrobiales bacterium]|nr:DUF4345 domain-containing protein [Hyphomicrobiales bacterium]MCP4997622.1 DUF4345 domain-containing protein [Hyphomicrobiales bacterium]